MPFDIIAEKNDRNNVPSPEIKTSSALGQQIELRVCKSCYMSVQNNQSQQAAFLHITEAPQGHSHIMLRCFPSPSARLTNVCRGSVKNIARKSTTRLLTN